MKDVVIYTDGACSGNPGPGGYGSVLIYKNVNKELSGYEELTTNNRMEIKAVIEALKALKEPCNIKLYTDSKYVSDAFNKKWIQNWLRNNWKKSNKQPVENKELWEELIGLTEVHNIEWIWVKGHNDNKYNERCDELARQQISAHK
ncbi:MAG: ribonuclease HI [Clostridia bacterium]|nr:ribonuclease HI [Clostridia bacterium]